MNYIKYDQNGLIINIDSGLDPLQAKLKEMEKENPSKQYKQKLSKEISDVVKLTYRWASNAVEKVPQQKSIYRNMEEKILDNFLRTVHENSEILEGLLNKELVLYEARTLEMSKRENHGHGYHYHILIRKGGKYIRTGILVTVQDEKIYVVEHGNSGNVLLDMDKSNNAIAECIKNSRILKDMKEIKEFLTAGREAIQLSINR
jgi:hypothetical protein